VGNALDLNVYTDNTLDITLLDGETVLHVRRPSQEMLLQVIALEKKLKGNESAEIVLTELPGLLVNALGNNKDGVKITEQWLEDQGIDLAMQLVIFRAYGDFIQELVSDPNSKSPLSQG